MEDKGAILLFFGMDVYTPRSTISCGKPLS
jgi:hypothetical protein